MGTLIDSRARPEDVEEDVRESERKARERGGAVAEAAQERLAPAIAAIDDAKTIRNATQDAAAAGWTVVEARESEADLEMKAVRDEMWNGLDRPQRHPAMDYTFPEGVSTYTKPPAAEQPVHMQILTTRIRSVDAPQWTSEKRDTWIARIEAKRVPLDEAAKAFTPLAAAETVAEAGYRASVRTAHSKLRAFKRDLQNLGLTEKQIHEIIPDDDAGKRKNKGGGGTGGDPTA